MREWENQTVNIQGCAGFFVESSQTKAEKNCSSFLFYNALLKKSTIYYRKFQTYTKIERWAQWIFFNSLLGLPPPIQVLLTVWNLNFESPSAVGHSMCWSCVPLFWKLLCYHSLWFWKVCQSRWPENLNYRTNQSPFSIWTLDERVSSSEIRSCKLHISLELPFSLP